jgi:hypothetical protein
VGIDSADADVFEPLLSPQDRQTPVKRQRTDRGEGGGGRSQYVTVASFCWRVGMGLNKLGAVKAQPHNQKRPNRGAGVGRMVT